MCLGLERSKSSQMIFKFLLTVLIISVILGVIFKPYIDVTDEGRVLLWYGVKKRDYIVIF